MWCPFPFLMKWWVCCSKMAFAAGSGGLLNTKSLHVDLTQGHCTAAPASTPGEISVQTYCNRVYRQSQRHFNLSPRYLICREGTLEGPQPKRAHSIIEPVKDHIKGLVLMQTWQRGDREVKAWLGGDRGDKGWWWRGMRVLTWEMCCGEGWDSLHKGARLDRRREEKNKMVRRKRGFGKNSTSKNLKQSKKISEIGYNAPAFDFIQDYRTLVTQEVVHIWLTTFTFFTLQHASQIFCIHSGKVKDCMRGGWNTLS